MNFCQECGAALFADARFCESCGTNISETDHAKLHAVTSCIVVINSAAWRLRWGAIEAERLNLELGRYLNARALQSGISYRVADLGPLGASPEIENVIGMLRQSVETVQKSGGLPRYFLLIGGGDDVPMAHYDFACELGERRQDPDDAIATDHCYETLSAVRFGFSVSEDDLPSLDRLPEGRFIAGRIPFGQDTEPYHLVGYLQRAQASQNQSYSKAAQAIGVSALVWQDASDQVAKRGGIGKLVTSPDNGPEEFQRICETLQPDFLYFNLHGDHQKQVSGYLGEPSPTGEYPYYALTPDCLSDLGKDYVAVSEACYGARFWHPKGAGAYTIEESVMLTALYSKCIGFLGATRVAYGSSSMPSLADITAMRFLENVTSQGHWGLMPCSLGQAAYEARFAIPDSEDPTEQILRIKNRLIFHLYGDPTLFHKPNVRWKEGHIKTDGLESSESKTPNPRIAGDLLGELSLRVDSLQQELRSEISGRISLVSRQLRSEIKGHINKVVYGNYPRLSDVIPTQSCYRNEKTESFLLSYKGESSFEEVLIVCTPDGKITGTYERK